MHEPRRGQRDKLQSVLVVDAALRRIAGRLVALSLDTSKLCTEAADDSAAWVIGTLQALAEDKPVAARPETGSGVEALERLARQVELLAFTLAKGDRAGM
jgi:hypothetical protein